jgi:peptide-methionine (R)-S-oxide reductase
MMKRRTMLLGGAGVLAAIWGTRWSSEAAPAGHFEIEKSDAEWRRLLTPAQYDVLRKEGTERPGTSPLNKEKHTGTCACAGCDLPLFSSETKFESGTGWPSVRRATPHSS